MSETTSGFAATSEGKVREEERDGAVQKIRGTVQELHARNQ